MRIAQYHYDVGNFTCVHPQAQESVLSEAVRVSEYIEVEFAPRAQLDIEADRRRLYTAKREKLQAQIAKVQKLLKSDTEWMS